MARQGQTVDGGQFRLYDMEEELVDEANDLWQQNLLKLYVYTNQHNMGATYPEGYLPCEPGPGQLALPDGESIMSGESYAESGSQA